MAFDAGTRQIYIESEGSITGGAVDDVLYVFQLSLDGHSAALVNTVSMNPQFSADTANFAGMTFNSLPVLIVSGTGTAIAEQGPVVTLLTTAPTISDLDGDHLSSATVQVTGGLFASNESNATDDRLFFGATLAGSGTVAGTNISWSYTSATSTLTFTGYDTFANYQTAFAGVSFQSLGDNPTNYGLNTGRTLTWTVSDGALNVPGGQQNSGSAFVTITGVNDAPTSTSLSGEHGDLHRRRRRGVSGRGRQRRRDRRRQPQFRWWDADGRGERRAGRRRPVPGQPGA
jgi:hypothetical protein